MTCTGATILAGDTLHQGAHGCTRCGHRIDAHAINQNGHITCDVCAIITAIRQP